MTVTRRAHDSHVAKPSHDFLARMVMTGAAGPAGRFAIGRILKYHDSSDPIPTRNPPLYTV